MSSIYYDLFHNAKSVVGLAGGTLTAGTVTGENVDATGYKTAKVNYTLNAVGTSGTITLAKIQEANVADFSDATDVPADRIMGTITTLSTAKAIGQVGIAIVKNYIRPVFTVAGTNPIASSVVELAGAEYLPVQS